MTRDDIIIAYGYDDFLFADGLDDAIMGVDENQWNGHKPRVVYSVKKILDVLMTRDGMDYDQAREFYDFNIVGAYVGEQTPVFCEDEM